MTSIPLPDDAYLQLLGRVAYSVSYLEGVLLFDLEHLAVSGLRAEDLAGKTVIGIGNALVSEASNIADPAVSAYLDEGGRALQALGLRRNAVLHARPATIDGKQYLERWRLGGLPEHFTVDEAHMEALLTDLEVALQKVMALRPPPP